jgi:hypothetical protein
MMGMKTIEELLCALEEEKTATAKLAPGTLARNHHTDLESVKNEGTMATTSRLANHPRRQTSFGRSFGRLVVGRGRQLARVEIPCSILSRPN